MKSHFRNQFTGFRAPGFRFRFHVRSISRPSIFLPLSMKDHPKIQRLLNGESPLSVFNTASIQDARKVFNELRKRLDFAYWAITEFYIRDRNDADHIIPLRLNTLQNYVIDIFLKRFHNRQLGRYVITKTFFPCGLTTCVQAYIIWMQTYICKNNSYTCSSSDISLNPLKSNLCRWLGRDIVPAEKWLFLPKTDGRAFFNTYRNPDMVRGINLGYVHLADMSKWRDPQGDLSMRVRCAAVSGVLLDYFTLVVCEGNIPDERRFRLKQHFNPNIPLDFRLMKLTHLTNNPYFLDYASMAANPTVNSSILHIDLNDAFFSGARSS